MSHSSSSKRSGVLPAEFHTVSDDSASFVRRLGAILIAGWLGAIVMVAVAAPAAFSSVDTSLRFRTPLVDQAVKYLGEPATHDLLRYQVGEANRRIFESFGLMQVVLGAAVFFMLLFFSHVRRLGLGIALLMMLMSAAINWLLIPRIVETGRTLHTAQAAQATVAQQQFRALHTGFSTFEATVAVLGVFLLVLLLRRRRGGRGSSRSSHRGDSARDV